MRNLKKLLAVVLTVVMMASMMVPALAANTYEAEALKLQSIGMFAGEPADLKLEEGVTRIQGLAFAIRAAGVEADAFAMTDEEVAAILADYVDGADVPAWGVKYAAYAIKNSITVGVSATEKKFAGLDPISGTSFLVFLMKAGMGYADVTTADVIEASVEAGILTAGQAATFGAKAALIRDDAAGILFGAAMNGVNADGTPLIEALIASGFVDEDAALAAGFVVEVVPDELEVVSVSADNLKEIIVVFNKEVDKDTLEDNFKFSPTIAIGDPKLQDDGVTVVLTAAAPDNNYENQKEYTLTVEKVKALDGTEIAKTSVNVTPFDATLPVVDGVTITGPNSFVINFSEPMDPIASNGIVKVKSSSTTLSTKPIANADFDSNEVTVGLYTNLSDGKDYTIEISGFKDYAEYTNVKNTIELTYVKDANPPVASIATATQEYVEIKFDKPVKGLAASNFYHTYSAWTSNGIYKTKDDLDAGGASNIGTSESVSTVFVRFSDVSGNNYPLPAGDVEVNIKGKVDSREVKDNWGNKLGDVTLIANVTSDKSAPTVSKVEVEDGKTLKVTFDKALSQATVKSSNFEILDADGKKVAGLSLSVALSANKKVVTITLNKDMTGETLQLTIKDLKDNTINQNKMDVYTTEVVVGDSAFDGIDRVEYSAADEALYVIYKEEVNDTALDIGNYRVQLNFATQGAIKKLEGTTSFHTNNKIVKIDLEEDEDAYMVAGSYLLVSNVEDLEGNATFLLATAIEAIGSNKAGVKSIRAIDKNSIRVQFDQELRTVDPSEFELNDVPATGVELQVNSDGTVAIFTFEEDIAADVSGTVVFKTGTLTNTENFFGVEPAAIENETPNDYIAPSVVSIVTTLDGDYKVDSIVMTFDEDLSPSFVSALTWSVEGRTVRTAGLSGAIVTLDLVVDDDVVADALAAPQVTQLLDVKDDGLNGVLTADAFNDEEYETKSELEFAQDEADAKVEADYTSASWTDFENALALALEMPEGTDAEIVAKTAAINAAIGQLVAV